MKFLATVLLTIAASSSPLNATELMQGQPSQSDVFARAEAGETVTVTLRLRLDGSKTGATDSFTTSVNGIKGNTYQYSCDYLAESEVTEKIVYARVGETIKVSPSVICYAGTGPTQTFTVYPNSSVIDVTLPAS